MGTAHLAASFVCSKSWHDQHTQNFVNNEIVTRKNKQFNHYPTN